MHSCAGWKLPKPFNQDRVGVKSTLHSVTWVRPVPLQKGAIQASGIFLEKVVSGY